MARTDDAAEGSAAAAGEVGGAVQAEAEGVALRIERFDPADSTLAMVLNQVAHTLEQPSSKLRLSPSTVDLAMGHDHVIAPESLQYVRDLGAGAFATVEVHRYRPPGSQGEGQLVAVKRLKREMMGDALEIKHFIAECATLRKLDHPNLVHCHGVGSFDQRSPEAELRSMYLVQEYCAAGSLRSLLIKQDASLWRIYSYAQGVDICIGVASGLAYLHTLSPEKLVHRDIKLGNILLVASEDANHEVAAPAEDEHPKKGMKLHLPGKSQRRITYQAKIADLGLIKVIKPSISGDGLEGSVRNGMAEGPLCTGRTGSLMYMAPEVYAAPGERSKHKYNEKVDIYSLAMVMYEVFKRQPRDLALTDHSETETQAAYAAKGDRPRIPKSWPTPLSDLIQQCWAQEPAQRPPAADIASRLSGMRQQIVESLDMTGLYKWAAD